MKVERIFSFAPPVLKKNNGNANKKSQDSVPQMSEYRPAAYQDFNMTFGGRLFRTPANFFAQSFNQNGMPDTMKQYLFEDYEDRQNMPPVQMWKTVFSDINLAENLQEVKELYLDEPLFENLKSNPGQARNSIISEIKALEGEFENTPLFKDGSSDLGMYILKKIYIEGKSLKEINQDFKKDITDDYKGLIDKNIDYGTVKNYGIKFPNLGFWHSFIVTRDDFPYEYKPRKIEMPRHPVSRQVTKDVKTPLPQKPREGKFDKIKDWEVDKLSKAVIKSKNSKSRAPKELKNSGVRDEESLNFVAQYLGEINSIVLERLHVSDEMKDFFEHYDDLSRNQKEKFEEYWKNPDLNRLQSKIMSDTIKLFFNTYGADGNNQEFQELLDYAHSLKPQRLERQKQHDALQEEYEKTLGIFETEMQGHEENASTKIVPEDEEDGDFDRYQKIFEDLKKEYNVEAYDFVTKDGDTISIVSNLKEGLSEQLTFDMNFIPQTFVKNFINFMVNNPRVDDSYILTTLLKAKGIKLPDDERLMPEDKAELLTLDLYQEYTDKYPAETRAAQQAVTDTFIELSKNEITPALFRLGVFEFPELYKSMRAMHPSQSKVVRDKINSTTERFNYYKRPLSDSEIRKATITIMELLRKYNPDNSIIKNREETFKGFDTVFGAISLLIKDKNSPKAKDDIKNNISKYLREYGGSARFLLDKSMPDALKTAKMEQLLCNYAYDKPGELLVYVAATNEALNYVKSRNLDLYNYLMEELLSSGILYAGGGV